MLNTNFRISGKNSNSVNLKWASPNANDVSWIFINGVKALGPLYLETTERVATIKFKTNQNKDIEIHDFPDDSIHTDPITLQENTKPLIKWNAVATAKRYQVFYHFFGEVESKIYDQPAVKDQLRYEIKSPIKLKRGWNFFRVEAIDEFGNASAREFWNYPVYELPLPVTTLDVTEGSSSGLFNFTIF